MNIVEDIKNVRVQYNITQGTLAKMVQVSILTIQLWERGVAIPNEQNMKKLNSVIEQIKKGENEK